MNPSPLTHTHLHTLTLPFELASSGKGRPYYLSDINEEVRQLYEILNTDMVVKGLNDEQVTWKQELVYLR